MGVSKTNKKQSISFLQKCRTKQTDGLQDRDKTRSRAQGKGNGKSVGKKMKRKRPNLGFCGV